MRASKSGKISQKTPEETIKDAPPKLYPDLFWAWEAFSSLAERRGVGPNGPLPITTEAMQAYLSLTNRHTHYYRRCMLLYVSALDREYLSDFYTKQAAEYEKRQRESERSSRNNRRR